MTPTQLEALRLLMQYTGGTCDAWRLAGDANAGRRQHIMVLWTGSKLPKSKCGVTAMVERLHLAAPQDKMQAAGCMAAREDVFLDWAREQLQPSHSGADQFLNGVETATGSTLGDGSRRGS